MKKSFGVTVYSSLALLTFAFLTLNCTKVAVTPTRQVSSSTKHLDRHINAVLKKKDIQPSEIAEDTEFLRRVHLDLTGKIPAPEDVLDFLKDGSPNKRQKKIDQLLGSAPYIDYWTRLWVNWLIGRRGDGDDRRIGLTAWVRDALTKNMPYNQFVQELIAADGELKDNGAGNYIMRYERAPAVLTSHSSRLFLGLPMQCAECHDHKTEVWSQKDYYGIAAFFNGIESEQKGYIETMDMVGNEKRMENFLITNEPRKSMWVERMDAEVSPRFLGGTEYKGSLTKRREALAQWMTDQSNPYFSRAIVNRVWKHFMGRAFVEPIDGFGEENPPTNSELLDWLAENLVIYDYDLQHLMRTILNSETYQRTSETNKSNKDDEQYYSHAYVKPLSAEQFFYSLLQATGFERLQETKMKGSNRQGGEDRMGMLRDLERTKREHLEKFLFLLDNGEMEEIEAFNGTVPQALMMINGNMVNDSASHGERGSFVNYVLEKWRAPADRLEYIYLNVLSRLPTAKEKTYFQRYMERSLYRNKDLAYEDLYWVLLNSAEFSLNH
ncbi:DUF1549 domain-containing protein [Candidatus Poribacteria bacterium]|nr:DUF1549 domain-containing protein [Candidatus Poribacteria bacterium]MYG08256.1 DUF1549 domain-containing protein [Candidatus Poribacteria bacterium]MYK25169.1 DUF1549 domain-containing protein [Candidatus Poribacteria bacterium]